MQLRKTSRRGAVLPMFALLLPVMFMLAGLAINTAYLQMMKTEMKIVTDSAAHAGGRAMSLFQNTQDAVDWAEYIANRNLVDGSPLEIDVDENIDFGLSRRAANGFGRYEFDARDRSAVDSGSVQANSISVLGHINTPLIVRVFPAFNDVDISARSIATQVDRDIALVLDRSGSMMTYKDESALNTELYWDYRYRRISYYDYYYARYYLSFSDRVLNNLSGDMYEYAYDRRYVGSRAPRHSRWAQLEEGVNAFLDVLEDTDQEELVSVATFSSSSSLNQELTLDYAPIRELAEDMYPSGATAIGQGINEAVPSIMTAQDARPFAAKTIVILTDGINNRSPDPVGVVNSLMDQYNVTIHTVTFTNGADQDAMATIADLGGGNHYHANDGNELVEIFEEIANNLPTIISE